MNSRPFAIVAYPVSRVFRERLVEQAGSELDVLDVPTLRRLPLRAMLATLRSYRGQPCLIPLEDADSAPLLPVLESLAVVSGASSIEVLDSELNATTVSRGRAFAAGVGLVGESAALLVDASRARRQLAALAEARRAEVEFGDTRRLLYVNGNLWFGVKAGGSIGHVAGVVNGLLTEGLSVDVAAAARQPLVQQAAGFVPLLPSRRFGLPSELNQVRFSRAAARTLAARASSVRYAALYQRLSLHNYAGVVASRAAGIPLVVEYNGSEVWVARHWGRPLREEALGIAAEDASLRHAHVVVTVSNVLADELLVRGVEPERLVTYPNCVDADVFDPGRLVADGARIRESLGFAAGNVVVAFVGTFGRWHGAAVLAQAIRRLADADPDWLTRNRVYFLLVGDGLEMPAVRRHLGRSGAAVTTLTGLVPQANAPAYLAASDVLVSPHVPNDDGTPFFGSPTKLFEYMAMGRAIVASDLDQLGEVLRPALSAESLPTDLNAQGELAILTRPGDIESLIRGIRFAVERPAWRAELGAAARRRVVERYTWRHHVRAILDRLEAMAS